MSLSIDRYYRSAPIPISTTRGSGVAAQWSYTHSMNAPACSGVAGPGPQAPCRHACGSTNECPSILRGGCPWTPSALEASLWQQVPSSFQRLWQPACLAPRRTWLLRMISHLSFDVSCVVPTILPCPNQQVDSLFVYVFWGV
ncbi:uncharacterized protein LOC122756651 [Drosophila santomea]|uniref:uncharacterized protein LOC122756651 n=1 Tax=Drosophila santomea TaxID=129105 RepID=UPI001CC9C02F|nr:uncharacterized protein LOC122756651 [Drosophila santomea]